MTDYLEHEGISRKEAASILGKREKELWSCNSEYGSREINLRPEEEGVEIVSNRKGNRRLT